MTSPIIIPTMKLKTILPAIMVAGTGMTSYAVSNNTVDLVKLSEYVTPTIHIVTPSQSTPLDVTSQTPQPAVIRTTSASLALPETANARGAYIIEINPESQPPVTVKAADDAGVYYAGITLGQLVDAARKVNGGLLPAGIITDWADISRRGVVEGFYGTPWSHQTRMSVIDYMGKNKLNTYIFGPKDDPYHSTPHWREQYPDEEGCQIADLAKACNDRFIDFVWAVHPGRDIRWDEADRDALVEKFNMMYDLGVRGFAIFFDDITGNGTNSMKQVELLNYLTENFVKKKGDVARLLVCPTDYSRLWASTAPDGQLAIYGKYLNPEVDVCYTGDFVCSDLTHDTMKFVNDLIKRPAFYWWNFPVSDYCRYYLLAGPAYGLDTSLTQKEIGGFASNPMEQGEASKPALCGVADYCWNTSAFVPLKAWERGLEDVAGDAYDAYRLFAIHNANSGKGYARDESWETDTDLGSPIDWGKYDALEFDFQRISDVPAIMRRDCDNKALLAEIDPWLDQFGLLGQRGEAALRLISLSQDASPAARWNILKDVIPTNKQRLDYNVHSVAITKLKPFIDSVATVHTGLLWNALTGQAPYSPRLIASFTPSGRDRFVDNLLYDDESFFHSGVNMKSGDWLGIDIGDIRDIYGVKIKQGRTDNENTDFLPNALIEYSTDGNVWQILPGVSSKGLVLKSSLKKPVKARYIRMRSTDTEPTRHWLAVRSFEITADGINSIGSKLQPQPVIALPGTPLSDLSITSSGVKLNVPAGAKEMTVLLDNVDNGITINTLDTKGKVISTLNATESLVTLPLPANAGSVRLSSAGKSDENAPVLRGWCLRL